MHKKSAGVGKIGKDRIRDECFREHLGVASIGAKLNSCLTSLFPTSICLNV